MYVNERLFADIIYVDWPHGNIVMIALSLLNYRIKPTKDDFDLTHSKSVIRKLAQFHGVCAILQTEQSDIYKNFKQGELNFF